MIEYEIIIIGGGITGVSLARLFDLKHKDVVVFEAEKEAGGLCRTKDINGHYLDIGGGHFFYSKYKEVYDFVFSHIPEKEFNYFERISKIKLNNEIIDYPIESSLWQLSLDEQIKYLVSVANSGENSGKKEPKNYEEWIKWKLGEMISSNYMIPYNEKIWGVKPKDMDIDWLNKIPKINFEEILRYSLEKKIATEKYPSHPGFYYPKEGGFQRIFDSIYEKVKSKVILSEPVVLLEKDSGGWIVNGKYHAKYVINTAPWNKLNKALGKIKSLQKSFERLQNNKIVISLWEEKIDHDWHWLYNPDLDTPNHREFYINNFSKSSKGNGLYTETNFKRWSGFGKFMRKGHNPLYENIVECAYPIPVIGHASAAKRIIEYYEKQKLFGVGRWGQWQYLNSDVCIKSAIDFVSNFKY